MFHSSEGKKVHNESGDLMYSLVTIVNNSPVLYTLKLILIIVITPVKQTHLQGKLMNILITLTMYIYIKATCSTL